MRLEEDLLEADDPAEYLENIGFDVEYIDDETVKVKSSETDEGEPIYIVIKIENIPRVYEVLSSTNPEELFDEIVEERIIGDEEDEGK